MTERPDTKDPLYLAPRQIVTGTDEDLTRPQDTDVRGTVPDGMHATPTETEPDTKELARESAEDLGRSLADLPSEPSGDQFAGFATDPGQFERKKPEEARFQEAVELGQRLKDLHRSYTGKPSPEQQREIDDVRSKLFAALGFEREVVDPMDTDAEAEARGERALAQRIKEIVDRSDKTPEERLEAVREVLASVLAVL